MTRPDAQVAPPPPADPELPEELAIDTGVAKRIITEFIRAQLRQAGFERAVLALSGGIDSALVAFLVADAIGAESLLCVLMPYRTSSPESRTDAQAVVELLGCASTLVDISPMVDGYFGTDRGDPTTLRRGNLAARMRMAVLYDHSVTWGGLAVGTGNKTEGLIGYTTIFGDAACAFAPIGDLYKSQVRQLARVVGVPDTILAKRPSADLWAGQTDEDEMGLRYRDLDRLLFWMIDRRRSPAELTELGFEPAVVDRVARMVAAAEFKRQVPPIAKLGRGPRASTTSTPDGGPARNDVDPGRRGRWDALRRRHADRESRGRVAPLDRRVAGSAAGGRRGHAADPTPLGAPRHHHKARQLPRSLTRYPRGRADRPPRGR